MGPWMGIWNNIDEMITGLRRYLSDFVAIGSGEWYKDTGHTGKGYIEDLRGKVE